MANSYQCATCGAVHDEVPLSYGAEAPYWYYEVAPEERASRVDLSSDQCVIDDEHFFIRGVLEIPVVDSDEVFSWGVWVSLSETSFLRACDIWDKAGREAEPPYFGWLSTELPLYPSTMNLKTMVQTRRVGLRPTIELEPTDHPLALEQRQGITLARVHEIAHLLLEEDG